MTFKELKLKFHTNFKVLYLLLVINIFLFILSYVISLLFNIDREDSLLILGAEFFPLILNGQIWRMLLPAFLHFDIFHLLLNMWALWNIGEIIENFYGGKKLFLIYIWTGIFGSLASVFATAVTVYFTQNVSEGFSIGIGASGAIFGLIGLILGNKYKKDIYSQNISNYFNTSQLWIFVIYNLLLGFGFNIIGSSYAINNWAHLGGLVSGFIFGLFLEPINTYYSGRVKNIFEKLLFISALLFVILGYLINFINLIYF